MKEIVDLTMLEKTPITFAVAVNNREVFEANFLASGCFSKPHDYEILVQEGFASAAKAYNSAIGKSHNDMIVFCHQDIFLPESWPSQLENALNRLETDDPNWGVLGCYGETLNDNGRGYIYSSGRIMGRPFERPAAVQTLDEIVLILRKSSGLRFDDELPNFHLYGTDICLSAAKRGMKSYAISAFCIHNTHEALILPEEFYQCCRHIKRRWREYLPIQATCIRITRFNRPLYRKKLADFYLRYIRRTEVGHTRLQNPQNLFEELAPAASKSRL